MGCTICNDSGVLACRGDGRASSLPGALLRPYVSWGSIEQRVNSVFAEKTGDLEEWKRNRELWMQTVEHRLVPGGCPFCALGTQVSQDIMRQKALTQGYYFSAQVSTDQPAKGLAEWAFDQHASLSYSMPNHQVCQSAANAALQAARIEPAWRSYAAVWSKVIASYQAPSHSLSNVEKPM